MISYLVNKAQKDSRKFLGPRVVVGVPYGITNVETRAVRDATGIFMTGGNQLRLSSMIGGTRLAEAIMARFMEGATVAGTSAGASAISSHMIAFGASGATPKHRMAQIAAGLGLLPGVIVDQHFQQRNRLGRLLSLIAQNPMLLAPLAIAVHNVLQILVRRVVPALHNLFAQPKLQHGDLA